MARLLPSREYLAACFDYDPVTGELRWRHRPRTHFSSDQAYRSSNALYEGRVAGAVDARGYVRIGVDGKKLAAHRIIWMLATGEEPSELDHKDRDKANNRLDNLRPATRSENCLNKGVRADCVSRVRGVGIVRGRKWRARAWIDGVYRQLGTFDTMEAAEQAIAQSGVV